MIAVDIIRAGVVLPAEPVIVECPRCDRGTYNSDGRYLRCAYCGGSGRVYATEGER